ncbi:MAG: septum site-determining protein MinC [Clostridia bacterium]|jgi:septum site-determining protein MinC|nr:septum site-determining protein MinC [Clostridia bacterium]
MSQEAVNIKGTKNGLVIVLDSSYSFEDLKIKLQEKIASAKGFFKGAKFTIMAQKMSDQESEALQEICCEYGLVPADNIELPKAVGENITHTAHSPQKERDSAIPSDAEGCFLITHSLRSGQKVYHDGHITVLGDVNAGAEIVAGGNILVMGSLRGVAHAGASGDRNAVIVAWRLEPDQLRISDVIARSPEETEQHNYPERAYLSENSIIIEPYSTTQIAGRKKALF